MHLEIITPQKTVYSGEADRVKLPGVKGQFELLNNHAPIISTLTKGSIRIIKGKEEPVFYAVEGGIAECKSNKIIVLTEQAEQLNG